MLTAFLFIYLFLEHWLQLREFAVAVRPALIEEIMENIPIFTLYNLNWRSYIYIAEKKIKNDINFD